jgi:hypothetical protein
MLPSFRSLIRELDARPTPARTRELLTALCALPGLAPEALRTLHERLLFARAYPRSRAIYELCTRELAGFEGRVAALPEAARATLDQSGMAGTRICYPYDLHMARWLQSRLGEHIEIEWDTYEERDSDPLSELLPLLLSKAEQDAVDDGGISTRELVQAARPASQTALGWLLERLDTLQDEALRQKVFNDLELALDVELTASGPSRTTWDDGDPARLFLWDPAAARVPFDLVSEIKRPLRLPPPVAPARGRELLELGYGVLLPRLRELYPAIHGNPAEVYDIALERGVRVVLWFMRPAWRLPLEAGWGIVLLKNHVPIGYGAGAMLDDRAEIAINVFDTFRGGEAAWLFAQYARISYTISRAPWLVTRKYQVGYENEEGLGSGSFWFYDKLGFRSVDGDIRALADEERTRIRKEPGYRSPKRVLRKLSQADVVMSLDGKAAREYREFPLGAAGLLAARQIAVRLGGERSGLEARVWRVLKERFGWKSTGLTASEKAAVAQMGLLVLALEGVDRWPQRAQHALMEFCRLKGSPRAADFARAFTKQHPFFTALREQTMNG